MDMLLQQIKPSRATMFTGKYSTSHGIYTVADNQDLVGSKEGMTKLEN